MTISSYSYIEYVILHTYPKNARIENLKQFSFTYCYHFFPERKKKKKNRLQDILNSISTRNGAKMVNVEINTEHCIPKN